MLKHIVPASIIAVLISGLCLSAPQEAIAWSKIRVTSDSFVDDQMMPDKHAYDNDNVSPPIKWSGLPEGTKTLALICEDPDAPSGNWTHWVIFNIPASSIGLPENIPDDELFDDGAIQGTNDFKTIGYDGPYPPYGTHRYIFKVYALDTALDLEPGATRGDLLRAMKGHLLGEGSLTGRYKRKIDTPKQDMIE